MKLWKLVGIFLVALLAVFCSKKSEPVMVQLLPCACSYELQHIDSIMQSRPDSALVLLLSYPAQKEDETLSDSLSVKNDGINAFAAMLNRNYFYLLVSEALFKTDNMQTVRPQVQQAECFFDSLAMQHPDNDDITFLSARSHYMNGVGFYENDSVVEACKEYLNALEIMEAHFNEDELVGQKAKFMALSYNRLVDLFSDNLMMDNAIVCGKKALFFCEKARTSSLKISNTLYRIGVHYNMSNSIDSAVYYYNMAVATLPDTNNLTYRNIISSMALISYELSKNAKNSINVLKRAMSYTMDNQEKLSRHLAIGHIYFYERQYDSALLYVNKVFESEHDQLYRIQACDYIKKIHDSLGNSEKEQLYAKFLSQFVTPEYDNKVLISKLNNIFQQYIRRVEAKRFSKDKHIVVTNVIVVYTFAFLTVIFILTFVNKHKNQKKLAKQQLKSKAVLEESNRQYTKQIEKERIEYKMNHDALLGRLRKSNSDLKQYKKQLTHLINYTKTTENEKILFEEERICIEIIGIIKNNTIKRETKARDYHEFILSKTQLAQLSVAVERHFSGFDNKMAFLYPKITRNDLNLCHLFLLGAEEKHAAIMLNRDYSSVRRQSLKLKKAFNTEIETSVFVRNNIIKY